MRYRRDAPRDDQAAVDAETEHVRAHLSACATPDDDPDARAEDVHLEVTAHVDGDPNMVSIVGEINAEPIAPYLRDDYDPSTEMPMWFVPYEERDQGHHYDRKALASWRAEQ